MSGYDALASSYDALMADGAYRRRADFLERLFRKSRIPVCNVLDLACGTGTIACLLAERGYRVTAVDGSEEMLAQAAAKAAGLDFVQEVYATAAVDAYVPDTDAGWGDFRCADLRDWDLSDMEEELFAADFDTRTQWPADLPGSFEPERLLELGKDPGLGLRALHEQGITGKGVGIAIIDQTLLVEHREYADRLRLYQEYHTAAEDGASTHGPAVASIALGETVGVAPEALPLIERMASLLQPAVRNPALVETYWELAGEDQYTSDSEMALVGQMLDESRVVVEPGRVKMELYLAY